MASIDLGAHVGQQNMTMDELRATWRRLDQARVDWISAWDHLYEAPPAGGTVPHFEAVATLAALCTDTVHARVGCLVFYVGYRNPGIIAKAATTLDHLSGGRFELGLGAGWHEPEAEAFGFEFPPLGRRFDMLEEAVPLIRRLLTEDRTTHEGDWFRTVDASCLPKPVQARLPIWVGGVGETRTIPLAAAHADGWNAAYTSPAEFRRLGDVLDASCDRIGRDPGEIQRVVNLQFNLVTDGTDVGPMEERLRAQWGAGADRVLEGGLNGTPEQAVERILAYRDAGATGMNIALRAPWDHDALDAYLDEVLPAVRAA